jgi:hypothetical protein
MHKSLAALIMSLGFLAGARAQEYMPYPTPRITAGQWESYLAMVKSKFQATEQQLPEQRLIVFRDDSTRTQYSFTTKDHPAHPAWITRQIVKANGDVNIRQIGYFAGSEVEFAELFRAYLDLNTRMRQRLLQQQKQEF